MNSDRTEPRLAVDRAAPAMTIGDLLTPGNVVLDLRSADKRRLIDDLAGRAAVAAGIPADVIADAMTGRERLGSTGMGAGIAIPHARLEQIVRPVGVFARLRSPIDFDAIDGQKVDLVFLLLLPGQGHGDHLNALACVARRLRAEHIRAALRKAGDAEAAYALLAGDGRA